MNCRKFSSTYNFNSEFQNKPVMWLSIINTALETLYQYCQGIPLSKPDREFFGIMHVYIFDTNITRILDT